MEKRNMNMELSILSFDVSPVWGSLEYKAECIECKKNRKLGNVVQYWWWWLFLLKNLGKATENHEVVYQQTTCRKSIMKLRVLMLYGQQIIETRLKVSLPADISSALMDGVVLCHLANHVRPRSVSSIHVPSPAVVRLTALY